MAIQGDSVRNYQLRCIHMARRDLALSEADYRALVARMAEGRTDSSGELTDAERRHLLHYFRVTCGWEPKRKDRRKYSPPSRHKAPEKKTQADKIRAMWISLGKAGVVREPSEKALGKFCYRLTKKYSPDWLRHDEAVTVITALQTWAAREGVAGAVQA